jgi:Epoxide hydrolase N terminus
LWSRARSVRRGEEIFQRTDSRGGALEFENFQGERKTVTALFANIKGSAELETRFREKAGYNRRAEHTSQSNDCRECFRGADLPMSDEINPFRIAITDDELEDMKRRLRATRWPERECVDDWTQGLPLAYGQEVASYWLEKYDCSASTIFADRRQLFLPVAARLMFDRVLLCLTPS